MRLFMIDKVIHTIYKTVNIADNKQCICDNAYKLLVNIFIS